MTRSIEERTLLDDYLDLVDKCKDFDSSSSGSSDDVYLYNI
jgi:hypothetical protein